MLSRFACIRATCAACVVCSLQQSCHWSAVWPGTRGSWKGDVSRAYSEHCGKNTCCAYEGRMARMGRYKVLQHHATEGSHPSTGRQHSGKDGPAHVSVTQFADFSGLTQENAANGSMGFNLPPLRTPCAVSQNSVSEHGHVLQG